MSVVFKYVFLFISYIPAMPFSLNPSQSFFFVGVAGAGMSAIAQYLSGKGFAVSGSDREFTAAGKHPVRTKLEAAGIQCFPQDGSGVTAGISAVIVSTAIEDTNPDLRRARELEIPTMHRSEMLALVSRQTKTIAVSGTSGKSTTTGMIFHILEYAGLSPSLITGAGLVSLEKRGLIGNAVAGKGDWLVVEADESDGSLVRYSPEIGLILNVDKDHKELSELEKIFAQFAKNIHDAGKTIIVNGERELAKQFSAGREYDFGSGQEFGVQGTDFMPVGYGIRFRVRHGGELVKFELPVPGKYNMENALAAVAASLRAGVPLRKCADALRSFGGIHRRSQILGTFGGVTVVDDFAHNPAKIAASIAGVQGFTKGRVIAWFQPHGFGPTRFLRNDLVLAIKSALRPAKGACKNDCILFSEIYYAGGTVTRDISAGDLANDLLKLGADAHYIEDRDACAAKMVELASPGDTILLMGARDPSLGDFAKSVADKLKARA